MKNKLVTVVIPIYLEEPTSLEKISLAQTISVLKNYPITFMAPHGLDTRWYEDFCKDKVQVFIERFNWKGYEQFSVLQTNPLFYERFLGYDYILICHLDAFVFRDELEKWCMLGFDFIGSVIYNPAFKLKDTLLRRMTGFTNPEYFGNGGFSLKKVNSYYRITSRFKVYVDIYHLIRKLRNKPFYDDLFFTQHFPKLSPKFSIAPMSIAQQFGAAYETNEEIELPFNNKTNSGLPFGIHGWIQHNQDYWIPSIRQCGHLI